MARDVTDSTAISSRDELVAWIAEGEKGAGPFLIGTEHEKIPFYRANRAPIPYDDGVGALLHGLKRETGWAAIDDDGALIGLLDEHGGGAVSLEPGGQFELSGAPLDTVHQTLAEFDEHMAALKRVAEPLGIGFLDLGMSPQWTLAETPIMPKQRYGIMRRYMPTVGARGLDMMFRTATVQANFDFASEADMVRKLRVSLALQPMTTALFANSPFTDGRPNGYLSMRSEIWRHTDAARTGMMHYAFRPGMGYEAYVDFALKAPLYFVKRGGVYHDVAGAQFSDLLAGRLAQAPGERATLSDWANHLSTIFPEVRLKRYLEMRGADVGPRSHIAAAPALFAGLLYDTAALDAASALIGAWTDADRQHMRDAAPKLGLATPIQGRTLREVALDALRIAEGGLARRARRNAAGQDETIYLSPLWAIADSGRSLAAERLAAYEGPWRRSVAPAFESCVF